ncbi:MAG: hypothetical protein QM652_01570 [Legionella sp.]|uniref:hypothetical protein n=1 Tax=Legionella sp. TaxID=459 RepID=UPI0039E6F491
MPHPILDKKLSEIHGVMIQFRGEKNPLSSIAKHFNCDSQTITRYIDRLVTNDGQKITYDQLMLMSVADAQAEFSNYDKPLMDSIDTTRVIFPQEVFSREFIPKMLNGKLCYVHDSKVATHTKALSLKHYAFIRTVKNLGGNPIDFKVEQLDGAHCIVMNERDLKEWERLKPKYEQRKQENKENIKGENLEDSLNTLQHDALVDQPSVDKKYDTVKTESDCTVLSEVSDKETHYDSQQPTVSSQVFLPNMAAAPSNIGMTYSENTQDSFFFNPSQSHSSSLGVINNPLSNADIPFLTFEVKKQPLNKEDLPKTSTNFSQLHVVDSSINNPQRFFGNKRKNVVERCDPNLDIKRRVRK